ncbi:MAG: citrate/2-methylcitrate synthase [Spirochaetales bacterium]|uniref:citrate synthase (unknown stereospecificity) n=1 Tax=Candidatus Thalassospirochaeta sargassi TaxID=3119039 RepID=A0AAJ1IFF1_9SPIO|nr:citrate/2-methylcitrate synthase [Spirochaetales bacterium]
MNKYVETAIKNNQISPEHYKKFNVKRGLRNEDGSGVLVGLTGIGDVHGYIMDENEKIPVEGRLRYRGIDLRDICEGFQSDGRYGYEEVIFLLLFGQLPNRKEFNYFFDMLGQYRALPKGFTEDMILNTPSNNIMNKLSRSVLACYSFDDDPEDSSVGNILKQSIALISRFPTIVAHAYQAKSHYYDHNSLHLHTPDPQLGTAENFLSLIRPDQVYSKLEAETLDLCMVLHAEHGGGNNSAFTIHVVSSAMTDTYSTIAAGIGSLKGDRHGGANIKVHEMFVDIKENVKDWSNEKEIKDYIIKILNKEAYDKTGLLYGIGHAVYTISDPRAVLLKKKAEQLAKEKGMLDEYHLYEAVERLGIEAFQEYKNIDVPMSANVDFYSGFVYRMLNIPTDLYTPLFAIARISGWCAHRIEEIVKGGKIMRPAFKAVASRKSYLPIDERE